MRPVHALQHFEPRAPVHYIRCFGQFRLFPIHARLAARPCLQQYADDRGSLTVGPGFDKRQMQNTGL
jgi:hypothetical protein